MAERYDIYRSLDVGTTGVLVRGAPCRVHGYQIHNQSTSIRYIKLYNVSTAPTVGTTTPAMTIGIPASTQIAEEFQGGIYFATGIGIGGTTGIADGNSGAPTANDISINLFYKEG